MEENDDHNNNEEKSQNSKSDENINEKKFQSDTVTNKLSLNNSEENEENNANLDLYEIIAETSEFNSDNSLQNPIPQKKIEEIFYLNDIKDFNPEEFSVRKYGKKTIELGKLFFKYRFIKERMEQSSMNYDLRASTLRFNTKLNQEKTRKVTISNNRMSLNFNSKLGINMDKSDEKLSNKSEYRKYNSKFLLLLEKSIFNFNLKKYLESYNILLQENIVKSCAEFGEFLLVVNGYNKYTLGTFLAKDKPPNDQKEILKSFVNSIYLIYEQKYNKTNTFLEYLRFFLSRIKLPEDSNLILDLMDVYSTTLFNTNKDNKDFISKFPSSDAIYLLISSILALNTMFTRKDIKNMNIIQKDKFIEMNSEIAPNEAQDIYEKLEQEPISMKDNYSENNYKRMTILVKKKDKDNINSKYSKFIPKNNLKKSKNEEDSKEQDNEEEDENEYKDKVLEDNDNNLEFDNILKHRATKKESDKDSFIKKCSTSRLFNIKLKEEVIVEESHTIKDDFGVRQSSFSFQENLESFSDKDKEILTKPTKFEKIISKSSHHIRAFIVDQKLEKLIWAKDFDTIVNSDKTIKIKKIKGTVHTVMIKDIEDVYNGIDNSELISEYIKSYPNESKEASNFIAIKIPNKEVCIKANTQEIALSWFKALKSLVLQVNKIKSKTNRGEDKVGKLKKLINTKVKEIWNKYILPHWNVYGQFLQYKLKNKINDIKRDENNSKNNLLEEKIKFSLSAQSKFISNIRKKLSENVYNYLDYNEFLFLYKIGIPDYLRSKIWTLLIGNTCGITLDLYKSYFNLIKNIDFEELIKHKNLEEYLETLEEEDDEENKIIINQILTDIFEIKDTFISGIEKPYKILWKVYRIVRIFFLMRPDISYNKSLINFSFIFILVCEDEFISFRNIFNLVCSNNTLQFYLKNENYIRIRVQFFDDLLKSEIPKVREHFQNLDISTELFLVSWFENIFSFTFDFNLLKRIYDAYILNGEYILFLVGLTVIKIQESDLLSLTIGEVFKNLNKLQNKYKGDLFLEIMNSNNIYKQFEKWKTDNEVGNQKIKLLELVF